MKRAPWFRVALALGSLALAAAPLLARAQESQEVKVLKLFFAQDDLVTAPSKIPEEARTAPAVVSVFTAEDIKNMGARTLSDLLKTLSSVYVTFQTSSRESVWFRGIRNRYNDKVLLLVDGVPWRDVVYEHASIDEYFPLTNVERVEVIRGPGSALYGTNAYAGVIQVITKSPPKKPSFSASAQAGNWDTKEAWAEGGGSSGKSGVYAWIRAFQTDGDGVGINVRNQVQVQDWNPKRQTSGGITFTHGDFTLRAEMVHYFHTYFADTDTPVWRWRDEGYWYDDTFVNGEYAHAFSSNVSMKARLYGQDYDWKNFWRQFAYGKDTADATPADVDDQVDVTKHTRRVGGEFQLNIKTAGRQEIVAGVTGERESILSVQDLWTDMHTGTVSRLFYINPVSLVTWAAYLQDTWKSTDWLTLTGGLRADHHSLFGWHFSPRLGAAFHPGGRFVAKILYGEAFRAPSSREFYTVDLTGSFPPGNPSLQPEGIQTLDAAFSYTFSSYAEGELVLYQEKTWDAIYSENNAPYANYPGTRIRGVEAALRLAFPNRVAAKFSASTTSSDLYNVPKTLASAMLDVPVGDKGHWNLAASFVGTRPRDPQDLYAYDTSRPPYHRPDVPSFVMVDTTLRTGEIWRGCEFSFEVHNLLDKEAYIPTYEPTKYNDLLLPGRSFLFRVGVRF